MQIPAELKKILNYSYLLYINRRDTHPLNCMECWSSVFWLTATIVVTKREQTLRRRRANCAESNWTSPSNSSFAIMWHVPFPNYIRLATTLVFRCRESLFGCFHIRSTNPGLLSPAAGETVEAAPDLPWTSGQAESQLAGQFFPRRRCHEQPTIIRSTSSSRWFCAPA